MSPLLFSIKARKIGRAFTLIELLVSIGILSIVLAILLPALAGTRGAALSIKSLSNARQLGQVISAYTDDENDVYPTIIEGRLYPDTGLSSSMFAFPYWQVTTTWTGVIFDLLPYAVNVEVYISPGSTRFQNTRFPWPTSYQYSTSFVGDPALWRDNATPEDILKRGARTHEVRFPSSKVLLWDSELAWVRNPRFDHPVRDSLEKTPMVFADLSGSTRIPANASEAVPNPFIHFYRQRKLHNTRNGVHGLDY